MIASANGDFRKLQANTQLSGLLGRTADVILPKGVHKTCRVESPTLDLVVELKAGVHDECVVIHNTADAVDNILNEQRYRVERRYRCRETGNIRIKLEMH
ncbi:hypothetical protein SARC_11361 [Sphaeroforma arctica JP610]|uniref:Uncharacterized protein n=1 Tax=Sphaeroforma arctica JP610 TaxID=667725 RepID=A0A0L0FI45_9EUKA|nr:hypothetical protein SARC_11361 [Sphaeroforma arctica JP610]KNC76126.1 hypothetical protein SARC_11361 [Sphaeroforma arctica JP610]|eukprot:XP_014150028.1 hypothetical protein SARC_11361 [Sphaeroforma arctica JP610]